MASGTRNLLTDVYAGAALGKKPRLQATRATAMVMRGEESAAPILVRSAATPVVDARSSMLHTHHGEVCMLAIKVAVNGMAPLATCCVHPIAANRFVEKLAGSEIARKGRGAGPPLVAYVVGRAIEGPVKCSIGISLGRGGTKASLVMIIRAVITRA